MMNTPSPAPVDATQKSVSPNQPGEPGAKARSIHSCNFRAAGRLSNEDARAVIALHETVANYIYAAFDALFGTSLDVKFAELNQTSVHEHLAGVPTFCFVVQCSSGLVTVEIDLDLVFPIIELLMGGVGNPRNADRDLSEIEEEVMRDIVAIIVKQAEAVWAIPGLSIAPGSRIKPSAMLQTFRPTEKLTALRFEASLGNAKGNFSLILSNSLLDLLTKQIATDRSQKKSRMFSFPALPLRERILDCEMEVLTELPGLRVSVKDLVTLAPGSVLKLRSPVQTPAALTIGGRSLFRAVPVRSGQQRAAQLGHRTPTSEWKER
jgi:flagellar motor switch protein FliM